MWVLHALCGSAFWRLK